MVALLASAWIEMTVTAAVHIGNLVALLASAWIEIIICFIKKRILKSRTPRECVD